MRSTSTVVAPAGPPSVITHTWSKTWNELISEMISTQRGYQANTRVVTVTDAMLEELVNMKR